MPKNNLLESLGLTKNESEVYSALVEIGPALISEISRKTGIHRPIIYKTLPKLKETGLINVTPKGKQKQYYAESPEKLKELFNSLRNVLESKIIKLQETYSKNKNRPVVKFLEGKKDLLSVIENLVKELGRGEIFYRYSSRKANTFGYLPKKTEKLRDLKGLQRFVITSELMSSLKKKERPSFNRAVKAIPNKYGLFDHNIVQLIYGDKIAFVDYNTETAVVIENEKIAKFQKSIFKALYDLL